MFGDSFVGVAHLQLSVSPNEGLQIWRHCAHCKSRRPFISSDNFRVNANRKTLDVWLIYRCTICDQTWNYPIYERKAVKAIDPSELDALMQNDTVLARRHSHDVDGLRAAGVEVTCSSDVAITRTLLTLASDEIRRIVISVVVPVPSQIRLDRLLATGLSLKRSDVHSLHDRSAMEIQPNAPKALKRSAVDGQQIHIDLSCCLDIKIAKCLQGIADT